MKELVDIKNLLKKAHEYELIKEQIHEILGNDTIISQNKQVEEDIYDIVVKHKSGVNAINKLKKRMASIESIEMVDTVTNNLIGIKKKHNGEILERHI